MSGLHKHQLAQVVGAWLPGEDALLCEWQAKVGNRWSVVAKHIDGRTGQQCAQRWRHKLNPDIVRDKWSIEEDSLLVQLVGELGHHWASIARCVEGRTDQQCMGRWRRHLDPAIKKDGFSAEEDRHLDELYDRFGASWSAIAKSLKSRTPQQCRCRWHGLHPKQASSAAWHSARPPGHAAAATSSDSVGSEQDGDQEEDSAHMSDQSLPASASQQRSKPAHRHPGATPSLFRQTPAKHKPAKATEAGGASHRRTPVSNAAAASLAHRQRMSGSRSVTRSAPRRKMDEWETDTSDEEQEDDIAGRGMEATAGEEEWVGRRLTHKRAYPVLTATAGAAASGLLGTPGSIQIHATPGPTQQQQQPTPGSANQVTPGTNLPQHGTPGSGQIVTPGPSRQQQQQQQRSIPGTATHHSAVRGRGSGTAGVRVVGTGQRLVRTNLLRRRGGSGAGGRALGEQAGGESQCR
ncbi:MAG: hypothetical protein WDW36_002658 [Sanguina aurantia]